MIYAADSGNYADCLRASGFRVEEAHSGPHGVDRAIALQPDLIVLDFGLVGGEIVSRLRRAIASAIPIIALAESRYGAAVAGVSRSEPESAKPPDSA
jgi:DNA-binding response OmpR family regulator